MSDFRRALHRRPRIALYVLIFWLACFAPIATLLGHLYVIAPMWKLLLVLDLPGAALIVLIWMWVRKSDDRDFLLRIRIGLIGGLWGTLGYDLIRIPFHLMGQDPFSPIRAYGMWLTASPLSTSWTDAVGLSFHFSNGITLGWIFSLIATRHHWAWGVLWGLIPETLAISCAFGTVFGLRQAYGALPLAYLGHIAYGYPLGRACQRPDQALERLSPWWRTGPGWLTILILCLVTGWFLSAWQPPGRQPALPAGRIEIGPDYQYPGWLDATLGTEVKIMNRFPESLELRVRRPSQVGGEGESWTLRKGERRTLRLDERGIYQIGAPSTGWRSSFVAVHEAGDYRPVFR